MFFVSFQILDHHALQFSLGISYNRSHDEECLVGEAHQPRILEHRKMKAFLFCYIFANLLFLRQLVQPIFQISCIRDLCTKPQVTISSFKEIQFFRNINATFCHILHMKQRLQYTSPTDLWIVLSHFLHINRDDSRTVGRNSVDIIRPRAGTEKYHSHDQPGKCHADIHFFHQFHYIN